MVVWFESTAIRKRHLFPLVATLSGTLGARVNLASPDVASAELADKTLAQVLKDYQKDERVALELAPTGSFFRHLKAGGASLEHSFRWLSKGGLYPQTEALVFAAQEERLVTRSLEHFFCTGRSRLFSFQDASRLCRVCSQSNETVYHILTGCNAHSFGPYLRRHDEVLKGVYAALRWTLGVDTCLKPVKEFLTVPRCTSGEGVTMFWDKCFATSNATDGCNKPDLVVVHRAEKQVYIVEMAVCHESLLLDREIQKRGKYERLRQDLARQFAHYECKIIPVVMGALGGYRKSLLEELQKLPGFTDEVTMKVVDHMQKTVLSLGLSLYKLHTQSAPTRGIDNFRVQPGRVRLLGAPNTQ
ncbi:MAG: hypothetical protein Aurels2KO_57110 [Aureliella sp.]